MQVESLAQLRDTKVADPSNLKIDTELTVEEISDALGPQEAEEFLKVMRHVKDTIEHPEGIVGDKALILATQLAGYRTLIGVRAQVYKTAEKSLTQRKRKDIMLTMFTALEENINCLKLLGRMQRQF